MTDGSKSGGKSGVQIWRKVVHKLNAGAEQPLGEPDLVYDTLDDAVLVQTLVWLILVAEFLSYSQK
jgi:hypothetical protein